MDGPHLDRMPRFSTIGLAEKLNVNKALKTALSGYLGGKPSTGYWINRLQDKWTEAFKVQYAIPCNSATSGLLAACIAIGIKPGDTVWTTAYSMSATAACAKVLGANIVFIDIETIRYSINMNMFRAGATPKCIIVTNLFGHPAYLSAMRSWCDSNNVVMVEDNAQAPFAMENNKFTGTIGHIGIFSLNVHKHLQCGEGGVVVTGSHDYASRLNDCINHGELRGGIVGLNLRMTEPTAAMACAQLAKADGIIVGRIALAEELTSMFDGVSSIMTPKADVGCRHVYYQWAARILNGKRKEFVRFLVDRGFPMIAGYSDPLNRIFDPRQHCPMAEEIEDKEIITFEICAWNPIKRHLKQMREIIHAATDATAS